MVSTKALAAIALTLIIAMPIGIGFLTAVHQEETDNWQTTSSSKISDLMLNHQTPYYGSYKGSSNNSSLLGTTTAAPEYVTVTSNYSSLPIYDETSTTIQNAATSTNYSVAYNAANPTYLVTAIRGDGSNQTVIGVHDIYRIEFGAGIVYVVDWEDRELPVPEDGLYIYRNSANTWRAFGSFTYEGEEHTYDYTFENFFVQISPTGTPAIPNSRVTVQVADYATIPTTAMPGTMTLLNGTMKVGDQYYQGYLNAQVSENEVTINGGEPISWDSSTQTVQVAQTIQTNIISSGPTGEYASPTDGWTVPDTTQTYLWLNNQVNQTVTFYVKVDRAADQIARIGNLCIYNAGTQVGAYLISAGSESGILLGAYTYLQVVMSTEGYTITGLPSWPTMGTVPTTYNTISFDYPTPTFNTVSIEVTSKNWHFRVDNANIEQGTYPSTLDYTLNLQQIYPDTNIDIYLNSIGVYGDYINFGGALMTVENGSVTINGQTYRLLHAHLSAWADEGGHYSLRINGDEVATTSEPPTIFWGGEWSVTATAYKIEKVHEYVTVWHAGEFGLDKKGFAVAGLLACAAMFVALGMTGQRSGGKAGVLLLICGGAAIVFLLII